MNFKMLKNNNDRDGAVGEYSVVFFVCCLVLLAITVMVCTYGIGSVFGKLSYFLMH